MNGGMQNGIPVDIDGINLDKKGLA